MKANENTPQVLKKAVRDYVVQALALFVISAYQVLDAEDLFANLNYDVLMEAARAGVNALWIAVPTTIGLALHRLVRYNKKDVDDTLNT